MRERDSQRSKVYVAEGVLLRYGPHPMTIEECRAFAHKALSSKYIERRFGEDVVKRLRRNLAIWNGRGGGMAHRYTSTITLGVYARRESIVLHELVHLLVRQGPAHGWQFCAGLLDLVRHVMGQQAHDELKTSFRQHKVKFTAPRVKREMAPEEKAILVERLAVARAAKLAKAS